MKNMAYTEALLSFSTIVFLVILYFFTATFLAFFSTPGRYFPGFAGCQRLIYIFCVFCVTENNLDMGKIQKIILGKV